MYFINMQSQQFLNVDIYQTMSLCLATFLIHVPKYYPFTKEIINTYKEEIFKVQNLIYYSLQYKMPLVRLHIVYIDLLKLKAYKLQLNVLSSNVP